MAQRPYAMEFYKDPDRHQGICPVCNILYVKELPEDRRTHRAFHRRVVNVFEPKPSITLAKLTAATPARSRSTRTPWSEAYCSFRMS